MTLVRDRIPMKNRIHELEREVAWIKKQLGQKNVAEPKPTAPDVMGEKPVDEKPAEDPEH